MAKYLLADIGSTFTKVCLVDAGTCEIIGRAFAPTTVATDVNLGFNEARRRLPETDISEILVCSSAAGGLRIAAAGLVPELTAKAARLAALGAGGKVVHTCAFRITQDDLCALQQKEPDIILLSGGTDGGDTKHIIANAEFLQANLPQVPVIVAGNRTAYDELRRIFHGRTDVVFTANVLPELARLDLEPARNCIREMFLKRIVHARGLDRLTSAARLLMPTPEAVLRAVKLLAEGLPSQPGLGELLAIDMGGATTDVYSCARGAPDSPQTVLKGLPEPFAKRSVEADIGMRHTLGALADQLDLPQLAAENRLSLEDIRNWIASAQRQPEKLPANDREQAIDTALAGAGCRLAVARHAGRLEESFTPAGRIFIQEGKDLGKVGIVIGSGGPLINSPTPQKILAGICRRQNDPTLLPLAPVCYLDQCYILWAMGLLAEVEPAAALTILGRNLTRVGR